MKLRPNTVPTVQFLSVCYVVLYILDMLLHFLINMINKIVYAMSAIVYLPNKCQERYEIKNVFTKISQE